MLSLLGDVRFGARMLRKSPAFTAVAVITLALGIGANTAIFSVVDAVLLKPLPYGDPDRLVMVHEKPPKGERNSISAANFIDWRNQNKVFEHIAARTGESFNISLEAQPENVTGARVSANYFDLFRVKPMLGRTFLAEEEQPGRDRVVVLTHRLWQRRFGANTNLIGQSIRLNGEQFTVIGVLLPDGNLDRLWAQLWTPLAFAPGKVTRDFHFLQAFGRLKSGVSLKQAQAQMDTIASQIAAAYPQSNQGWGVKIDPLREMVVGGQLRQTLLILLGAVGCILLIACANVANLTLARTLARQKEVAIRIALGAGRKRLIGQFLIESSLLSLAGAAVGLLLAYVLLKLLLALMPPFTLPTEAEVVMDYRILMFTFAITALTCVLFGLVPAWQASKLDLNESLKEGGRGGSAGLRRQRFRGALVVIEVALALVLLVGAGLLIHSFLELQQVKPGFRPRNVLTMAIPLPQARYTTSEKVAEFYRQALDKIEALPGVKAAAVSTSLPLQGWGFGMWYAIDGRPAPALAERPAAHFQMIGPEYFYALGIPLLKGRFFTEQDRAGAPPVAIINETMARKNFPHENFMGKHVLVDALIAGRQELGPAISWEIVGVVGDVKVSGLGGEETEEIYVPYAQSPWPGMRLAVHTATDPLPMLNAIKNAIQEVDKDMPVADAKTMEQIMAESIAEPRFRFQLLGAFALVALALASVGIYGVISYSVSQRTTEIGIRMALGAQPSDVLKLVVREGMVLALLGVAVGVAAAIAFSRMMGSLLFEIKPTDPVTFSAVSFLLTLVALAACYIPARRASKVDPLVALRYE